MMSNLMKHQEDHKKSKQKEKEELKKSEMGRRLISEISVLNKIELMRGHPEITKLEYHDIYRGLTLH